MARRAVSRDVHVVLDVETSGFDPLHNEIVQIGALALTDDMQRDEDYIPATWLMKPSRLLHVDPKALEKCQLNLEHLMAFGVTQEQGVEFFINWFERLNVPLQGRITPVGHNIGFDIGFLQNWLGRPLYDTMFTHRVRDTMCIAGFINDRYIVMGKHPPFHTLELSTLGTVLGVVNQKAHDALADCVATAEIYYKLIHFPMQ